MAKWYTNWVLIIGGIIIIVVVVFEIIPILNDAESLTNTQKLIKAIPTIALSIITVIFIMIKSLHYRDDKDRDKEKTELQEKTNELQEKNNSLQKESNELRAESIKKDKELIKSQKEHTTAIHSFGKLLNENVANDLDTNRKIDELTNSISERNIMIDEELRSIKASHEDDMESLAIRIGNVEKKIDDHINSHH